MSKFGPTEEQKKVIENIDKNVIVSASAGTGKTTTLISLIAEYIKEGKIPVNRMLVATFTNNAANEMKEKLLSRLMEYSDDVNILDQIDDVSTADISTIHSFLQKLIKRNIDKLNISADYYLVDDNKGNEIRNRAFSLAYEKASEKEEYIDLLVSLHKEKDLLKQIVFALENHFSVLSNPKERKNYYVNNQVEIYKQGIDYLNKNLVDKIYRIIRGVASYQKEMNIDNPNYKYIGNYINVLQDVNGVNTLKENIEIIKNMEFGRIKKADDPIFEEYRNQVKNIKLKYSKWDFDCEEFWKPNTFIQEIYSFYEIYLQDLKEIKLTENCLDFNDLEKLAIELLGDEKVINEIQNNYDLIIIDEYQDTNPVQEKIIKLIGKSGKFIAVGDPKQGIYGFRNATSEIMKKDIQDFSKDGGVYYLTYNFRSDPNILNFVNDVFENIMYESNTGINYRETSKFKSMQEYLKNDFPPVRIDILNIKKVKAEEQVEKVYNIIDAEKIIEETSKEEGMIIAQRINELVKAQIYDKSRDSFRDINYSDITILVRGKGSLSERIIAELIKQDIPVISTLEKEISSNEEIDVIKSLLKISLDYKDDIALVGYLSSKLGGYTLDEILDIRKESEKFFYEEFKLSKGYQDFKLKIDNFNLDIASIGIRNALEKLFVEKDYYAYLLSKKDGITIKKQIDRLMDIIENSNYNFDLPSLLKYLDSGNIKVSGSNAGLNAVTITTMHASKGLEYPIVILAGLGKNISKNNRNVFDINDKYGLAMPKFSINEKKNCGDVLLNAIREEKKRKEFIDEIMLLYVAMTRAKSHLYIVGEGDLKSFVPFIYDEDVFESKNCLELIISSLLCKYNNIIDKDHFINNEFEVNIIDQVQTLAIENTERKIIENSQYEDKIKKYLDFEYLNKDATKMRYKQTVTSINQIEQEPSQERGGNKADVGIAYHTAFEKLDLLNTVSEEDIRKNLSEEVLNLVDTKVVLNGINLLKPLLKNKKQFKEKFFTMRIKANEVLDTQPDEQIMIQGIIDLFLIGDENILIDYKYTNIKDENVLINKYKKQLFIYKKSIEKSYNIEINKIFLLSLKYGELIQIK